jgi:hypothetical protein
MKKYKKFLLLASLIFLAGCASSGSGDNSTQADNSRDQAQNMARKPLKIENENLSDGVIGDLAAGNKILAVGSENTDGSIIAAQIIKGADYEDFAVLGINMGTSTRGQFFGTSALTPASFKI